MPLGLVKLVLDCLLTPNSNEQVPIPVHKNRQLSHKSMELPAECNTGHFSDDAGRGIRSDSYIGSGRPRGSGWEPWSPGPSQGLSRSYGNGLGVETAAQL